jgi:photosystem II stability/assembly factor-like uncharacterized protein
MYLSRTTILCLLTALLAACSTSSSTKPPTADLGNGTADGMKIGEEKNTPSEPAYLTPSWVTTGGPLGGLGYDVRMHPDNPDTMYVTDDGTGFYISTDSGKTWVASNKGITSRSLPSGDGVSVFCMAIDPNNPDRLWVGTAGDSGVYYSDDGGKNWNKVEDALEEQFSVVRGFTVEKGNSNVIYLTGEVPAFEWGGPKDTITGFDGTKGFVYKSIDGGKKWKKIWYGDNLTRHVLIDPTNSKRIWVSTGIFDRNAANSDSSKKIVGGVGILRSDDGGDTWTVLGPKNGLNANELYFGSMSQHPKNPNIILAAAGQDPFMWVLGTSIGGIYLTKDGGDTWTETLDFGLLSIVEFCPNNPNVAYAAAVGGVFLSKDGGETWEKRAGHNWGPPGIVAGFPIDAECDPRNADRIYINNYGGGVFLSEDGGKTWLNYSQGYTGSRMSNVVVSKQDPKVVYASARSGIFGSRDGGQTWSGLNFGEAKQMEGKGIDVDPKDDTHVLYRVGDGNPNALESKTSGKSWEILDSKFYLQAETDDLAPIRRVYFYPHDAKRIFAVTEYDLKCITESTNPGCGPLTTGAVLHSSDAGKTWTKTTIDDGMIHALAFSGKDDGVVFASVYAKGVYRSDNYGKSFELVNANPMNRPLTHPEPGHELNLRMAIAVDPKDSKKVFLGFMDGAIAISRDGGKTFSNSSSGMDAETTIMSFAIDPNNSDIVYAGSHHTGLYYSTNGGKEWKAHNEGLSIRAIMDLGLSGDGSVLYAATFGGGVFRLGNVQ